MQSYSSVYLNAEVVMKVVVHNLNFLDALQKNYWEKV